MKKFFCIVMSCLMLAGSVAAFAACGGGGTKKAML